MSFVLDASITMSWCFVDEGTAFSRRVLRSLTDTYAEVPSLWLLEVANVLAINERKHRITAAISDEFMKSLSGLDIRLDHRNLSDLGTTLLLMRRHGLTAYDAAYLELAKRKALPIATLDRDLLKAAESERIPLVA